MKRQTITPSSPQPTMVLRSYQLRAIERVHTGNTIVVLPTGAGKTLIAAECALQLFDATGPDNKGISSRTLFLVPTILLVEQQAKAIREWTGLVVAELTGGSPLNRQPFNILVATPKAFEMAQARGVAGLSWRSFGLVVFDEVHHVLKDHPYRVLAIRLRESGEGPRILGLTASLTYAVGAKKVQRDVQRLCDELRVKHMETAEADELRASGYHGFQVVAELRPIDLPSMTPAGILPESERKPHLMSSTFWSRVARQTATPFSLTLVACIRSLEASAQSSDQSFASPLNRPVRKWGTYAHGRRGLSAMLEPWYEALRLLLVSWEEAEDAATEFLRMMEVEKQVWPQRNQTALTRFWETVPSTLARFDNLKDVLASKFKSTPAFRGIVFVQQRVMTHILSHIITSDPALAQLKPICLYATGSPATASHRVTPAQAKERVSAFRAGTANLLIATVVAEEGMDVPAANCVVRFDAMVHAVSFVQGRGRARQAGSSFVVLAERADRPASRLEQVEREQLEMVRAFVPAQRDDEATRKRLLSAQKNRERQARDVLDRPATLSSALSVLNLYAKKTKVVLNTSVVLADDKRTKCCNIEYQSPLRNLVGTGTAPSAKAAKRAAALHLLESIRTGA